MVSRAAIVAVETSSWKVPRTPIITSTSWATATRAATEYSGRKRKPTYTMMSSNATTTSHTACWLRICENRLPTKSVDRMIRLSSPKSSASRARTRSWTACNSESSSDATSTRITNCWSASAPMVLIWNFSREESAARTASIDSGSSPSAPACRTRRPSCGRGLSARSSSEASPGSSAVAAVTPEIAANASAISPSDGKSAKARGVCPSTSVVRTRIRSVVCCTTTSSSVPSCSSTISAGRAIWICCDRPPAKSTERLKPR